MQEEVLYLYTSTLGISLPVRFGYKEEQRDHFDSSSEIAQKIDL